MFILTPELTPEQIAEHRAAYMHSLAVALIDGNVLHWQSASDEERAEVRAMLTRAEIIFPNEKKQALRHRQVREAEAQALKKQDLATTDRAAGKTAAKSPEKPSA